MATEVRESCNCDAHQPVSADCAAKREAHASSRRQHSVACDKSDGGCVTPAVDSVAAGCHFIRRGIVVSFGNCEAFFFALVARELPWLRRIVDVVVDVVTECTWVSTYGDSNETNDSSFSAHRND